MSSQRSRRQSTQNAYGESYRSRLVAALLCLFFGLLGIHRFYVGKWKTGLLQLFTGGGFVVWAVIDFIFILFGAFTDAEGRRL